MLKKNIFIAVVLLFILTLSSCSKKPDSVFINGKIYTMDNNNTIVEAVAVKEGKIIETGTTKAITDKYGNDNAVDLKGAVVIPGLIDANGSLVDFSENLNFINLTSAKNLNDVKKILADKVKSVKPGEWIGGYGWNEVNFSEEDFLKINKSVLDEVAPNNNVYLINYLGNIVWVNSKLLNSVGIDKNTQSPGEGEIEKDEKGELTGIFIDDAQQLIKDKLPETSHEEMAIQIERGAKELLKYGITEVHDRNIAEGGIEVFKELIDKGSFPIRMYAVLTGNDKLFEDYLKKGAEINYKDKLTVRSVCLDYDGAFEIQDAAMKDDYKEEPKRKIPYSDEFEIEKVFKQAIDKNFQFSVKTVGDRAFNGALNTIEKVIKEKNPKDHRTILSSVEFTDQSDINRLKDLKVLASVNPEKDLTDMPLIPELINPEVSKKAGLWNSILKSSGFILTGSEFPFNQINPFIQMYYLTSRQWADTVINLPGQDQKLTILEALKSYTIYAAYSSFEEGIKGSIEKDKFCDMVVISNDIFTSDPKKLLETKVLMTITNGKVVYDSKNASK
ncbi:MAG: amidohydrolase [Bacteroidetes bacterium]|nr:amidohydrolase [Bacteroidota bacterium]